jgi:4-amino-4-deoxy-L-arabinose transferase-like glycosyltransferase
MRYAAFLFVGFVLLAGGVSLVNPLFESTDEIRHYRYVRTLVVERRLPVQGQEEVRSQSHHPPLYYVASALVSAWVPTSHTGAYQHPTNPFWGHRYWDVGVDNKLQYWHGPDEWFPYREGVLAAMIPRWVNVLFGALTVVLTYLLARRVWTGPRALAGAAAAIVALNPQFVYLSAAMNNDVVAAAAGAALLLSCVDVLQRGAERRRLVVLGGILGLALLSKLHLAAMGVVVALALGAEAARATTTWRAGVLRWLRGMAIVTAVAALLAGWWFVRNTLLYGDPTGMARLNELWAGRSAAGHWWALGQGLPYLWGSLWGRFGYGEVPMPSAVYTGLLVFCALGLAGYLLPRRRRIPAALLALLCSTVLLFTGVVVYYILIQPAGAMGRFLFPALPAFSVLLVGGFEAWLRRPAWVAGGVALSLLALAAFALLGVLWPAVRYPPRAPDAVHLGTPLDLQVGDVARVLAVDVTPAQVRPGEPLLVSVVWEPLRWTERPYTVYVHLVDEVGAVIAQRDTWPGLGRAPTTSWRSGYPFVDTYRIDLPESIYTPNSARVRVGLYEPSTGRLPVVADGDPALAGDGLDAGAVEIAAVDGAWPNAQYSNFADEIALVGYELEPRALGAGGTLTVTLYWQVLQRPRYDYAVFAQVLDEDYRVWGSRDSGGLGWTPGAVVTDTRRITLLPETPEGTYPIQVGLFHSETGRLPVVAPDGHYLEERVLLGPIRVRAESAAVAPR